jgi:hypothetical protein
MRISRHATWKVYDRFHLRALLYFPFVLRRILLVAIAEVLTGACGRRVGSLPLPAQQSLDLGPDPGGLRGMVRMDDPDAGAFLVRDISSERGVSRWAFRSPELRFRVKDASHLKFAVEFTIPEVTFRVTGPVTVSCAVNGKTLATMRYGHAGEYRLEHAVPKGLVEAGQPIHVTFDANPRWVSPEDGAQLSFLLRSAGFTQ